MLRELGSALFFVCLVCFVVVNNREFAALTKSRSTADPPHMYECMRSEENRAKIDNASICTGEAADIFQVQKATSTPFRRHVGNFRVFFRDDAMKPDEMNAKNMPSSLSIVIPSFQIPISPVSHSIANDFL